VDYRTDQIRRMLSFLMFIETKVTNKPTYNIATLDMGEIDGFYRYMAKFMPE
jgi:hypothetical protein